MDSLPKLINMLTLPAGIITLESKPELTSINQRLMRHLAEESKVDLNHPKIKDFLKKFNSLHGKESATDLSKPFGVSSNNLIDDNPTLFLVVPIYGDESQTRLFLFAFKHSDKFHKEEILHSAEVWHDINNPLAVLMMASSKIEEEEILEQHDIDRFFSIINDVTSRINQLGIRFLEQLAN